MQTPKETSHEIKTKRFPFSLVSDSVETSCFSSRVKIPYQQFLTFLSFQHRCFDVNIEKFLRAAFLQNFSSGFFYIILKKFRNYFRKVIFKEMSLL